MSDNIFFEDENILVTNTRLKINNETYILPNITSVRTNVIEGKKGTPPVTTKVGCGMAFLTFIVFMFAGLIWLAIFLPVGIILIIIAIACPFIPSWYKDIETPGVPDEPDTYELVLRTAAGEIKAFKTQDKNLMFSLVEALNKAFDYGH